jgi:hypothetical protein
MRKIFVAFLMFVTMTTTASAQTGLSATDSTFGGSAGTYELTYFGSGGAAYWHSLWYVEATNTANRTQLICKDSFACSTNSLTFTDNSTVTFTPTYDWIFGLLVQPFGVGNTFGQYFLWSDPALNSGTSYIRQFADSITQDNRVTEMANTAGALGWEDVRHGGDYDFNDFVFNYEFAGGPTETDVVPEPTTMTLLATGLIGLAAKRRRKQS